MNYLVGYDGTESAERALKLAMEQAKLTDAFVHVVFSMKGGESENWTAIKQAEASLGKAKDLLDKENVPSETVQLARGLTPGEDLIQYAEDKGIDAIFLGIKKRSRTHKLLLGSTAQLVILKGPCPVTTTK